MIPAVIMMKQFLCMLLKYIRSLEVQLNLYCERILEGFKSNTKYNVTLISYPQNRLWLQRKIGFTNEYLNDWHKQMRSLNLDR